MNSILEETEEQLEREADGQELATPGMFGTLSDEDSEDHLDHQYEDDAGHTAHEDTGDHDTTLEREYPEVHHEDTPEQARSQN